MFAKLMSISDVMMWRYFELLSFRSIADIAALKARGRRRRATRATPRWRWRKEIVTRFHSAQAADDALADFVNRSKGGIPDDVPEVALSGAPLGVAQLLKQAGLCASTSEAMRMVDQGGVRIDGAVVSDKALKLDAGTFVLQVGKRKFARVTLSAHDRTAATRQPGQRGGRRRSRSAPSTPA